MNFTSHHPLRLALPLDDNPLLPWKLVPDFIPPAEATQFFNRLQAELVWQQREIRIYGRSVMEPRLVAWYGDPAASYRYSGVTNSPLPWHPLLAELRNHITTIVRAPFNSVLCNLYRDGNDSMGWHRDNEPELGERPIIASISLGTARDFRLRRVSGHREAITLNLAAGSLLLMFGSCQTEWEHELPKRRRCTAPRINLTFRYIHPSPTVKANP